MFSGKVSYIFFDQAKILKSMDAATRKSLSRAGAFVRQRMKQSMRRSKKSAPPGQPPRAHAGQLKGLIYFGYEPDEKAVVIGPIPLGRGIVPGLMERGGTEQIMVGHKSKRHAMNINIPAHPFAGPSLRAEVDAGTIPQGWRNMLK